MEKRFLSEKVVEGLKNFDLITTRETLSKEILEQVGLESYLYPDPAFSLDPVPCKLPDFFQKTVVGINFSPFTDTDAVFEENMNRVIQYILSQGMEVCFIPHVFGKSRMIANQLKSTLINLEITLIYSIRKYVISSNSICNFKV